MCVCCLCVCLTLLCAYVYVLYLKSVHMCMLYLCVYVCVYTYVCCLCIYMCVCVSVYVHMLSVYLVAVYTRVSISGTGRQAVVTMSPIPGGDRTFQGQSGPPTWHPPTPPTPPPDFGLGKFLQTQRGCDRATVCRHCSVSWQHGPRTETPGNGMKASLHKSTGH